MQYHVRAHRDPVLIFQHIAVLVSQVCLHIIMYAACETLRFEQFVENSFSPVTLHTIAYLERACQFLRALLSSGTLSQHVVYVGLHLAAHGRLLLCALSHDLLHPVDGVSERIDNLPDGNGACIGKFLLPLPQHVFRGKFQLGCHFGRHFFVLTLILPDEFVEMMLLIGHNLPMRLALLLYLCLQHLRLRVSLVTFCLHVHGHGQSADDASCNKRQYYHFAKIFLFPIIEMLSNAP